MRETLEDTSDNTEGAERKREGVAEVRPALKRPVRGNVRVRAQVQSHEIIGKLIHGVDDDAHCTKGTE